MTTKITSHAEYEQAIERLHALRSKGQTSERDGELAEIEAAMTRYETEHGGPGESKGRPKP